MMRREFVEIVEGVLRGPEEMLRFGIWHRWRRNLDF